ncbi:hypothetical protein BGE01nite_13560 [Brevifollis gellanilyticus]|uniref:DUF1573 domain-containing protein n=1 Tax=Brevifollis gellanilyticus TaxID=748831 RepID=A0A512M5Q3_9BACT|nr:hypothetical protein BGE01nite_13560 [Brevifollis gellanilyticus]
MNSRLAAAAGLLLAACVPALAEDLPKIEFEKVVYDFKTVTDTDTITGAFKFKNTGKADLMMPQPTTSCGCTVARMDKFIYHPGEEGSVSFEWRLTGTRGLMSKTVTLQSNDPHNPRQILTINADYSPLYEVDPVSLTVDVKLGSATAGTPVKIFRMDGKPLQIRRIETSQPWITAKLLGETEILVEVKGLAPPRRYNETVSVYAGDNDKTPVTTLPVFGGISGELIASPDSLFWSITDSALQPGRSEALVTRRLRVRSLSGKAFEIKNLASSLKGLSLELNELGPGGFEVTARLDEVPKLGHEGFLTFETSEPTMSKMQVPLTVAVLMKRPEPPVGAEADGQPGAPVTTTTTTTGSGAAAGPAAGSAASGSAASGKAGPAGSSK